MMALALEPVKKAGSAAIPAVAVAFCSIFAPCSLLVSCSGPEPIPVPAGGPEALPGKVLVESGSGVKVTDPRELAVLERLAEFYDLAGSLGAVLWPGWRWSPEKMPLAVPLPEGRALLVNHPLPPPGMDVAAQAYIRSPVFRGAWTERRKTCCVLRYRGCWTAWVPYHALVVDEQGRVVTPVQAMAVLFRLSCENPDTLCLNGMQGIDDSLWVDGFSPATDPRQRTLSRLEARMLEGALAASSEERCLEWVAEFRAVRLERRRGLHPEQMDLERALESRPGVALYAAMRALELAETASRSGRPSLLALHEGDPHPYDRAAAWSRSRRQEMLERMTGSGAILDRARFSAAGMAQAFLLDRLLPDWKEVYRLTSDPALEDLLFNLVDAAEASTEPSLLEEILERWNFAALESEERIATRLETARLEAEARMLEGAGAVRVVLDFSAPGVSLGYEPFDAVQTLRLGTGITAPDGMELTGPGMTVIRLDRFRVVRDLERYELRTACPAGKIRIEKEGKVLAPEDPGPDARESGGKGFDGPGSDGPGSGPGGPSCVTVKAPFLLELPGLSARIDRGVLTWREGRIAVRLLP